MTTTTQKTDNKTKPNSQRVDKGYRKNSPFKNMLPISPLPDYHKKAFVDSTDSLKMFSMNARYVDELEDNGVTEEELSFFQVLITVHYGELDQDRAILPVKVVFEQKLTDDFSFNAAYEGEIMLDKYDNWQVSKLYLAPDLDYSASSLLSLIEDSEHGKSNFTVKQITLKDDKMLFSKKVKRYHGVNMMRHVRREVVSRINAAAFEQKSK